METPFYKLLRMNLKTFSEPPAGGNEPPAGGTDPTPPPTEPGAGQGSSLTLESVQQFLTSDDHAKKWLQSQMDSYYSKGLETWKEKTMPSLLSKEVEKEISKRYPPESEEAKQLRELKQQFERLEVEKQRESLRNKALSVATEKNLPTKLVDYFIGNDENATTQNLSVLEEVWSAAIQQGVEAQFKAGGRDPQPPAPGKALTKEQIEKMTPQEINDNWEQIEKILSEK